MADNLVNMQDLDNYLKDVVYRGQEKEIFESGSFNSIDFVEQHKDAIVRSMLLKWSNYCLKPYMSTKTPQTMRFLPLINVMDHDLPAWAKRCMNEGKYVYRFQADKIPDSMKEKITTVRDYLYAEGEKYVNKVLAQAKDTQKKYAANPNAKGDKNQQKPRIRIDYLKTIGEYADFNKVLAAAQKWHETIAENKKFRKYDEKLYQESLAGTEPVMDLGDGMHIVRLKTSEALDFESDYMGHCVGKGGYDRDIETGEVKIYSLRDENGEPHATFEVRGKKVEQCKGKQDKAPVAKYRPYVQEFVRAKKLDINGDAKNIGLIKYKGEYYDLYNLPKDKKIVLNSDLDFSEMELTELPDLSTLIVKGNFDVSKNKLTNLYGSPLQVGGRYDCRSNNLPNLDGISKRVNHLDISDNPITSLFDLPQIDDDFYGVNVAIKSMQDLPQRVKAKGYIYNPKSNLFAVAQEGKFCDLLKQPDGFVYDGFIDLSNLKLKKLPDFSHIIITEDFYVENNRLTSFVGAPKKVGGIFYGNQNPIINLEGMSQKVKQLDLCGCPKLCSLKGIAEEVTVAITIMRCPKLNALDYLPRKGNPIAFFDNKIHRKYHMPKQVNLQDVRKAVIQYNASVKNITNQR